MLDEKFIEAILESNNKVIDLATKAIDNEKERRKRDYTMYLATILAFVVVIVAFIICYFNATYDKDYIGEYSPNIAIEQRMNSDNEYIIE